MEEEDEKFEDEFDEEEEENEEKFEGVAEERKINPLKSTILRE